MAIRGLVSLLAGMGNGYNEGAQQRLENDRRAQLDQLAIDRARRETTEFDQQQQDRAAVRAAAAPVAAVPDMVQGGDGPVQATLPDPSTDSIDVGQSGTAPSIPSMRVGGRTGLTPDAAASTATMANSLPATARRVAAVAAASGNIGQGQQLTAAAAHMNDEGHIDFINQNMAAMPSASDIAAGRSNFPLTGVEQFNQAGGARIPDGARGQAFITTLPNGQQQTDFRVVGPNGEQLPAAAGSNQPLPSARQFLNFIANTPQQRDAQEQKIYADSENRKDKEGDLAIKDRMATVAEKNADTNEKYRRDSLDIRRDQVDSKGASAASRMDPADKITYDGMIKRSERLQETIDKLKADGAWDPKNPNHASLESDRVANAMRAQAMLTRVSRDGAAAVPDPLGVRPSPGGRPGAVVAARPPNAGEADMRRRVALTPDEQRASDQVEANPTNLAAIDAEIARTKNPDTLEILKTERAQIARRVAAGAAAAPAPSAARPAAAAPTPVPADDGTQAMGDAMGAGVFKMPTMVSRIGAKLADLGRDYTTPEGKALLRARVDEAKRGGPPLTDTEALRARQAGLDGASLSDLVLGRR